MNKTYDPKLFEEKIYQNWLNTGYFHAHVTTKKKPYTVIMPPPNITGRLHIGHALDNTLQDAIVRYKRMRDYEVLYMPGTDHASIATEVKIVESLISEGLTKDAIGREGFLERAHKWNEVYGGTIVEQQKKLGLSCDWERAAFTMDEKRSESVKEAFIRLYDKGLIYRGNRITNRCICCKTVLSDAEVEYQPASSHLWHLRYPLEDGSGYVTVATTRPETMLGDTAVAVNPKDMRYKRLVGKTLVLPLTGRKIPIIADDYVEKDFGSGAVKITPAHDPNDFEVSLRHNLPIIEVIGGDGIMTKEAGAYAKLTREEARQRVVADLTAGGYLAKTEPYENNVGHCYRCNTVVEPLVSKQWYVKMKPLAKPAIESVKKGNIEFIPQRFEKQYYHWMDNTRDWCISRQLWWGHRIPVYYCKVCGKQTVSKTEITNCACGGQVVQDEDVMDTWFSSALWPFSTLGWPDKNNDLDYFFPTHTLVTGYDIIGFWVSRMIFSSLEYLNKAPFKNVLIHGLVLDKNGKKMSKSSGNGVDPLKIIEEMGADVLRLSLVSGITTGGDVKYSEEKAENSRNFLNKLWNAARFVLLSAESSRILGINMVKKDISLADRWILGRLNEVTGVVNNCMESFEIGQAASAIYDFVWNEFCDWYIEMSKTTIYGEKKRKNITISVLLHVLRESLKLAHPIIPFITAEIYSSLPNRDRADIMIASYPKRERAKYNVAMSQMNQVIALIKEIRNLRREMNVPQNKKTAIYLLPSSGNEAIAAECAPYIQKLAGGSLCELVTAVPQGKTATVVGELGQAFIPMGDLLDTAAELARLNKELENVNFEIERAEGKLNNESFTKKAPAAMVEAEKEKINKYTSQREKILAGIAALGL